MSHTLGQTQQNNQQSNFSLSGVPRDSKSQEPASSTMSTLSDSDYEFLFNQLLEGIAHGWHDRRIVKFFAQVEDRADREHWIAWLERLRVKASALPSESKHQLGTMMIRLGELTRSTAEIKQIGTVSHRIGKELLFGNIESVWEYVGPDLPSKRDRLEPESSDRLQNDLTVDTHLMGEKIAEKSSESVSDRTPTESKSPLNNLVMSSTAEPNQPETKNDSRESWEVGSYWDDNSAEETASSSANSDLNYPNESKPTQELEPDRTAVLEELTAYLQDFPQSVFDSQQTASSQEKLSDRVEAIKLDSPTSSVQSEWDSDRSGDTLPLHTEGEIEAIDIQQVINLIQEDEELARQISQKLNLTLVKPQNAATSKLDRSSLELIESWFNLGLKQVSAGELTKAIASWEKALSINPNLSEAWHNRGSALGRLGNYQAAIESFQNALAIDPNNYQAWNDRAHALYQLQNWVEAVDSWGNAIKIMPGNHLFWYNRGCALEQLGIWDEAIASHEKALEIVPDFPPARSRYINLVADSSRSN